MGGSWSLLRLSGFLCGNEFYLDLLGFLGIVLRVEQRRGQQEGGEDQSWVHHRYLLVG